MRMTRKKRAAVCLILLDTLTGNDFSKTTVNLFRLFVQKVIIQKRSLLSSGETVQTIVIIVKRSHKRRLNHSSVTVMFIKVPQQRLIFGKLSQIANCFTDTRTRCQLFVLLLL